MPLPVAARYWQGLLFGDCPARAHSKEHYGFKDAKEDGLATLRATG
jgi:hypothetical protein